MGNRFQFHIVDPGRPADSIIKLQGQLANHFDPAKQDVRSANYNAQKTEVTDFIEVG
jgi:hypothetical protein